jgi:hypothetical protein
VPTWKTLTIKAINDRVEIIGGNFCRKVCGFSFTAITFDLNPFLAPVIFAPKVAIIFSSMIIFKGSIILILV